jgi:hypothetical protein
VLDGPANLLRGLFHQLGLRLFDLLPFDCLSAAPAGEAMFSFNFSCLASVPLSAVTAFTHPSSRKYLQHHRMRAFC